LAEQSPRLIIMPNQFKKPSQRRLGFIYLLVVDLNKYLKLSTVVYLPVIFSGLILVIGFAVGKEIYQESPWPNSYAGIILLMMWLMASLSGFIQIAIEEVPGALLRIEGKAAIAFGILWIGIFWLLTGWTIWNYFF
jgi:hypothetical protein